MKKSIALLSIILFISIFVSGCASTNKHNQISRQDIVVSEATEKTNQINLDMIAAINRTSANVEQLTLFLKEKQKKEAVTGKPKKAGVNAYKTKAAKKKPAKAKKTTNQKRLVYLEWQHKRLKNELANLTYRVDNEHKTKVTQTKLKSDSSCLPELAKTYFRNLSKRQKAGEIKIIGIRIITGQVQPKIGITNEELAENRYETVIHFLKSQGVDTTNIVFDPVKNPKDNSMGAEVKVLFQVIAQ